MKEITAEIKAKVFAMYWNGEYIYKNEFGRYKDRVGGFHFLKHIENPICKLILRTIDQLTDEECIEVKKITKPTRFNVDKISDLKKWIKNEMMGENVSGCEHFHAYQYLLSIGIDLPNFYLDGKTLIESGLAIKSGGSHE